MSAVVNVLMMIYLRDCKDGEGLGEGATHVCMRDDIMANNQHNGSVWHDTDGAWVRVRVTVRVRVRLGLGLGLT